VLIFPAEAAYFGSVGRFEDRNRYGLSTILFCQGQEGGIGNGLDERVTQSTERQAWGADIFSGASVRLRVSADGALINERAVDLCRRWSGWRSRR